MRRICTLGLFLISALLPAAESTSAAEPSPVNQVFQFVAHGTAPITSYGKPAQASCYLWIPEGCQRLRGLLILGNNVPEHRLVGHPVIRAMCAEQQLGIVWSTPTILIFDRKDEKANKWLDNPAATAEFLERQLAALAETSGYAEVATVPWIPIGESGHLKMVDALVQQRPQRCVTGIFLKNHHLPPNERTVPALVVFGTAQEWSQDKSDLRETWRSNAKQYEGILGERKKNPAWALSYVIDGHSGHFDCSERLTAYVAAYTAAMAQARLGEDGTLKPLALNRGFVADLPVPGHGGKPPTAAAGGEPLPWYPDQATAVEAQAYAAIDWTADTRFPVFCTPDGAAMPLDFNGISRFKSLPFEADGVTFTLRSALAPAIPAGFVAAGAPLAQEGTPVAEWLCGPVEPLGGDHGDRFRLALDRTWLSGAACYLGLRLAPAEHQRGILQPAGLDLKAMRNQEGKAQVITFPALADVRVGSGPITLAATADSGLPVAYFVVAGPAVIHGDRLELTALPPRAKLPAAVTVAAWQWGRGGASAVKTAEIVQRTFQVLP